MALLRYANAEAANIKAASDEANRKSASAAALAVRKAIGGVTAASIGLGNVDDTHDVDKPVSTATQTALNAKPTIVAAPVLPGSDGVQGQIAYDAVFVSMCVATNTWRRAPWAVWV